MSYIQRDEEYARILDFLPKGLRGAPRGEDGKTILAIGETYASLLALEPIEGAAFAVGDRVYLGEDESKKDFAKRVRFRFNYEQLTEEARAELPIILAEIVRDSPSRYLRFFNVAGAITMKFHALQLLGGIGAKSRDEILEARSKKNFADWEDLKTRGKVAHPQKLIVERIIEELADDSEDMNRAFTRKPVNPRGGRRY